MAGGSSQEDIEAVRERTDIVKLVGQYLTLKKAGRDRMTGLCPFHQEKTPSFSVSPGKQVFYCFGCGKGGDAITFLRELEHLSYVEAVERLASAGRASRSGTRATRPPSAARPRGADGPVSARTSEAAALFTTMLPTGKEAAEARAYVTERGISPESIETFGIGYAPGYPDFLLRRLTAARSRPEICWRRAWRRAATTVGRARPVPWADHVPDPRSAGPRDRVRRAGPADGPARERAGEVPQHGRDADLQEERGALQPGRRATGDRAQTARSSWSRATPT